MIETVELLYYCPDCKYEVYLVNGKCPTCGCKTIDETKPSSLVVYYSNHHRIFSLTEDKVIK